MQVSTNRDIAETDSPKSSINPGTHELPVHRLDLILHHSKNSPEAVGYGNYLQKEIGWAATFTHTDG